MAPGGDDVPDDREDGSAEPRSYASPVCYAHEFGTSWIVPHGIYRAIVEQAADAIIFTDRDGTVRVWNHGAESLFGYSAAEMVGASLDRIVPERFRAAHWQGFRHAVEAGRMRGTSQVMTTRSVHKDGRKLYVELTFGLVLDTTGVVVGVFALGRDGTARRLADLGAAP